jgi:hypothetical protein
LRIIYFHFITDQQIWLMTLYDKSEALDVTPSERKTLKTALEAELRVRNKRQSQTRRWRTH